MNALVEGNRPPSRGLSAAPAEQWAAAAAALDAHKPSVTGGDPAAAAAGAAAAVGSPGKAAQVCTRHTLFPYAVCNANGIAVWKLHRKRGTNPKQSMADLLLCDSQYPMHPSSSPWLIASCCCVRNSRCPAAFYFHRSINCHSLSFAPAPAHMLACVVRFGWRGARNTHDCLIGALCTDAVCTHSFCTGRRSRPAPRACFSAVTTNCQGHCGSEQGAALTAAIRDPKTKNMSLPWPLKCHVPWLPAGIPPGAAMQLLQRSVIYDQHPQTTSRSGRTGEARGATNQKPGGTGQRTC